MISVTLLIEYDDLPLSKVYNLVTLVLWGLVEQNVVIIAASIPTLRPFFHRTSRSSRTDSSNTEVGDPRSLAQPASKPNRESLCGGHDRGDLSISEPPLDDNLGATRSA
jgi:hypothetical protein